MTEDELIEKAATILNNGLKPDGTHPVLDAMYTDYARAVIAAVRPHIEAQALREAATEERVTPMARDEFTGWLCDRADRIERGAEQ